MEIDKEELLRLLEDKIDKLLRAAREAESRAVKAALESPSFMESQHTPRGELSNEALVHQRRVHELEQGLKTLRVMDLAPSTKVKVGSLVTVDGKDVTHQYWVVNFGGGIALNFRGEEILTVSNTSPAGSALIGGMVGDVVKLSPGAARGEKIVSVI